LRLWQSCPCLAPQASAPSRRTTPPPLPPPTAPAGSRPRPPGTARPPVPAPTTTVRIRSPLYGVPVLSSSGQCGSPRAMFSLVIEPCLGGACGFKNTDKYPFNSMTSCGNQPIFKDGKGCGACYQVRGASASPSMAPTKPCHHVAVGCFSVVVKSYLWRRPGSSASKVFSTYNKRYCCLGVRLLTFRFGLIISRYDAQRVTTLPAPASRRQ
jgi:hypothetical protein